jgi:hypothetical protein
MLHGTTHFVVYIVRPLFFLIFSLKKTNFISAWLLYEKPQISFHLMCVFQSLTSPIIVKRWIFYSQHVPQAKEVITQPSVPWICLIFLNLIKLFSLIFIHVYYTHKTIDISPSTKKKLHAVEHVVQFVRRVSRAM